MKCIYKAIFCLSKNLFHKKVSYSSNDFWKLIGAPLVPGVIKVAIVCV